jgi:hypothetical protein
MRSFHYHLHALPPVDCIAQGTVSQFGQLVTSWHVDCVERFTMDVTFEQVESSLSQLPRMFFEMDGSFVWCGEHSAASDSLRDRWQIDGMVYDVGGRVCRVELKGQCSADSFAQIVAALQPADRLLAFCINQSCFVRVDELLQVWHR